MIILFVNLICLESKFDFYISTVVRKRLFFLGIEICSSHVSCYVTMVDYVVKFQSNRVNFVSSQRFLNDLRNLLAVLFLCHLMLFWQFLNYFPFIYRAARFYAFRVAE